MKRKDNSKNYVPLILLMASLTFMAIALKNSGLPLQTWGIALNIWIQEIIWLGIEGVIFGFLAWFLFKKYGHKLDHWQIWAKWATIILFTLPLPLGLIRGGIIYLILFKK